MWPVPAASEHVKSAYCGSFSKSFCVKFAFCCLSCASAGLLSGSVAQMYFPFQGYTLSGRKLVSLGIEIVSRSVLSGLHSLTISKAVDLVEAALQQTSLLDVPCAVLAAQDAIHALSV